MLATAITLVVIGQFMMIFSIYKILVTLRAVNVTIGYMLELHDISIALIRIRRG